MTRNNLKKILIMFGVAIVVFIADQLIKLAFLNGFEWDSEILTLGGWALVFNDGVAFSMFAFLGENLKFIQIVLLLTLFVLLIKSELLERHFLAFGIIFGAGASNVFDRFNHGAVVDYVFWHYGFEFAIFNFADVMIDIGVAVIFLQILLDKKRQKSHNP